MADSKKYNGSTWEHSLRKLGTSTDTITTLPSDLYADGNNATVGLVGNMEQTGTPTPQNPIQPSETGERTGNLFDKSTLVDGKNISIDGEITDYSKRTTTSTPINVSGIDNVTLSYSATLSRTRWIYALFNDNVMIKRETAVFSGTTIDVSSGNKLFICFYDPSDAETIAANDLSNIMLNTGSTALPYQPYGYKIPILSGGVTTPVYLGEVQSTRRIKKLVLTGGETWQDYQGTNATRYNLSPIISDGIPLSTMICSHFEFGGFTATGGNAGEITGTESITLFRIFFWSDINTVTAWKTYLAQQYANGTPVCVWYVLATETTGIVNEPIRKIGDYADTVSGITIPTITGKDTFDVLTTLKPSEVSLAYTGWHDASVGEWDGSEWQ